MTQSFLDYISRSQRRQRKVLNTPAPPPPPITREVGTQPMSPTPAAPPTAVEPPVLGNPPPETPAAPMEQTILPMAVQFPGDELSMDERFFRLYGHYPTAIDRQVLSFRGAFESTRGRAPTRREVLDWTAGRLELPEDSGLSGIEGLF